MSNVHLHCDERNAALKQRISLLEKVAEAAERQYPNLSHYTEKALRAAGYLQEQDNE